MKKSWGTRAEDKLMVVHAVTLEPLIVKSTDGYQYARGFNDSYSRYAEVYFMQSKDAALAKFQQFMADVVKTATIGTDDALEYNSMTFNKYCREQAIRHEVSTSYMPEDNEKIERVCGTVVGMTKCMKDQAKIPPMFWTFALRAAFHLKNRILHSAHGSTPIEMMIGSRPNLAGLRVFGCRDHVTGRSFSGECDKRKSKRAEESRRNAAGTEPQHHV